MGNYSLTADIQVRFRDFDSLGHVNQAVYATYLEQARGQYYRTVLELVLSDIPTVIVHQSIDYRASILPEHRVEIAMRVPRLGTSSIPMEYEVCRDGEIAATAETVQVVTDPGSGEATAIPDEWRRAIEAYEGW